VREDKEVRLWAILLITSSAAAVTLKPATADAFREYISQAEKRLDQRAPFLWADDTPQRATQVRQGQVAIEQIGGKPLKVPDGLIHDWIGAVFVPNVTIAKAIASVQDYDHREAYRPEVMQSRILSHDGDHFRIFMRLLKKKVITVVLDTEHDIRYQKLDDSRWRSSSRTTKIAEVENPGKPDEREKPPGTGEGFLWNLNTYWRFQARDGGVWIECEAISLTRDVPTGLGWIINPIIRDLPKESLLNTLVQTRDALSK